jgi:hypothetical protein
MKICHQIWSEEEKQLLLSVAEMNKNKNGKINWENVHLQFPDKRLT